VEPLPKLDLLPASDSRYVPPGTSQFDTETVSVGYWQ
jgi:hypothetical protein